ncbi:hypothetical protein LSTR_LSTR009002 [Laodelphax striatellus]|uniref:Uncharacterized protein n=1 Tax=Laodelphax striatellus TaxID=195883 RepID=A0A482WXI4_LAOST|nr:hypothetical protein LSTR_LSTR009002 [Laodelphax striatellus]
MPGCGCAAPPPSSQPMNIPQSRGFLSPTSGFGGGGSQAKSNFTGSFGGGSQFKSSFSSVAGQDKSSFSSPAAATTADAFEGDVSAFNAPEQQSMSKTKQYQPNWKSPLKAFDSFATRVLRKKAEDEEDFPKLTMPHFRGLHKCKASSLNYHQVDIAIELEQELRNIGIQGTQMMEHLEKLLKAEAACQFQGAVRAAELAAMAAPNGLAEEAAVAAGRGYSVDAQQFSRMATGDNPIEIVGYHDRTRPDNF